MISKPLTSLLSKVRKPLVFTLQPRKMSSSPDDVIFENVNNNGLLILNRPKALNSLNLSMIRKILPKLRSWENEKRVVVVKGAGEKAFCAGGDVREVVLDVKTGGTLGQHFFREEYTTNGLIGAYKIPYIALIDGIVMGGGVGMSVHGKYRIATERTLFAMPETKIGLFPDVGGTYFLSRLQGRLGLYLALTGYRLKGVDVLKAGIATHFCESGSMKSLEADLLKCNGDEDVKKVLSQLNNMNDAEFSLTSHLDTINKCFTAVTVEEVCRNLENDGSKFALETLDTIKQMSPTSLKITFRAVDLGQTMSLMECLQMETRLAFHCLKNHDFPEGVRALLIDKDQKPKWNPATLSEVSESFVSSFFERLPEHSELNSKL